MENISKTLSTSYFGNWKKKTPNTFVDTLISLLLIKITALWDKVTTLNNFQKLPFSSFSLHISFSMRNEKRWRCRAIVLFVLHICAKFYFSIFQILEIEICSISKKWKFTLLNNRKTNQSFQIALRFIVILQKNLKTNIDNIVWLIFTTNNRSSRELH